ncbi:MAG TPA: hypothetical protein VN882_01520 [Steroidobacteraceae bacterium]|jgi:hypothetical protein|nr:hypothetical protein [Steroidobacteraceae bacterium]
MACRQRRLPRKAGAVAGAIGCVWPILGLSAGAALPAAAGAAQPQACGEPSPCTAGEFGARLVKLADEQDPNAVPGAFDDAFGVGLARHTRVLISTALPTEGQNNVRRFVQLGDTWYPLSLGVAGECVSFELLDRLLKADGWARSRTTAPGAEVWTYQKWRRQVSVSGPEPRVAAANAGPCVASIVLTYR